MTNIGSSSITLPIVLTNDNLAPQAQATLTIENPAHISSQYAMKIVETHTIFTFSTMPTGTSENTSDDYDQTPYSSLVPMSSSKILIFSFFATCSVHSYIFLLGASMKICPTRTINPTYTPKSPLPTDFTWGCPPLFLCQPNKTTTDGECNFEAGPPADTYYCSPEECLQVPLLHLPDNIMKPTQKDYKYIFSPGYFNLNPLDFQGLGYWIFDSINQVSRKRRDSVKIPGKCYSVCNDAMLEAEKGKTEDLCQRDAAFLTLVRACQTCVSSVDTDVVISSALPSFQQFLFYCSEVSNTNETSSTARKASVSTKQSTATQNVQSASKFITTDTTSSNLASIIPYTTGSSVGNFSRSSTSPVRKTSSNTVTTALPINGSSKCERISELWLLTLLIFILI